MPNRPCPVCGEMIDDRDYISYQHLELCRAWVPYPGVPTCACGDNKFSNVEWQIGKHTMVSLFFEHIDAVPHDWPKLITIKALEEF